MQDVVLQPVEFVALINQTLEFALPYAVVEGEVSNFRTSKNRWVYFDLKDEQASVKCFGTVYQLPGPIEDGMLMKVSGNARLHPQFGFSLNMQSMMPSGEGSIKKAAALLEAKLQKEGLFDPTRKRRLPYPPDKIGLITSGESAAFTDFIKILNARWQGIEVLHKDVQVQGEAAPGQIVQAIEYFNSHADNLEALVVIRGGGSADDLAAFSTEQVTRAIAASRIPTLVAIGHEVDTCLAELAADVRASTPSNAAELLVPDKQEQLNRLSNIESHLKSLLKNLVTEHETNIVQATKDLNQTLQTTVTIHESHLKRLSELLLAYNPNNVLKRGYAVVRKSGKALTNPKHIALDEVVDVQLAQGSFVAKRIKE